MQNVLILGAGRSGTSLCAGLLSEAGYFMGDDLLDAAATNPKGFFEDRQINWLNEQILFPHMPFWRRIPKVNRIRSSAPGPNHMWLARIPLNARLNHGEELRRKIRSLVDRRPFCFKDPRFSYTLPVWRPYLADTVCICVFRDPSVFIDSTLKSLNSVPYLANLRLTPELLNETWNLMYQHIVAMHRHEGRWIFIHYQQLFHEDVLYRLETMLETRIARNFADRSLERSRPSAWVSSENRILYRTLCEAASFNPDTTNHDGATPQIM